MNAFRGNSTTRRHYKPLSRVERSRNHSAALEANIRTRKIGPKGERNRSILTEYKLDGYEFSFHATKGLRKVWLGAR